MFCRYCGKEIDNDSLFCDNCGKDLKPPVNDENNPNQTDKTEESNCEESTTFSFRNFVHILIAFIIISISIFMLSYKNPKTTLDEWHEYLSRNGITEENTIATMKTLQDIYDKSGGKMENLDLQTRASYYLGESVSHDFIAADNGRVMMWFPGNNLVTYEELQDAIKRAKQEDAKIKGGFWYNLFNRPAPPKPSDVPSSFRELGLE